MDVYLDNGEETGSKEISFFSVAHRFEVVEVLQHKLNVLQGHSLVFGHFDDAHDGGYAHVDDNHLRLHIQAGLHQHLHQLLSNLVEGIQTLLFGSLAKILNDLAYVLEKVL